MSTPLSDVVVARGDGHRDHLRGLRVGQRPLEPALPEAELRVAAVREAEVPYPVQGLYLSAFGILEVCQIQNYRFLASEATYLLPI